MENRKEDMAKLIAQRIADNTGDDSSAYSDIGMGELAFADSGASVRRSSSQGSRRPSHSSGQRRTSSGSRSGSGKRPSSGAHSSSRSASAKSVSASRKSSGKKSAKAKRRAKKKKMYIALLCSMIVVAGLGAGALIYFSGKQAYKDSFLENTYINGVNVGGMNQEEAITELKKASVIPESVYFTKKDGTSISVKLSEIGYDSSSEEKLKEYYEAQDKSEWIKANFGDTEFSINEDFYYDKEALRELLRHKLLDNPSAEPPVDARIIRNDDNSFAVVSEIEGDMVDERKLDDLYDYVEGMLDNNVFDIDLASVNIYKEPRVKATDLYDECRRYNELENVRITFEFELGTEMIDYSTIRDWVDFDVDSPVGGLEVDRDKIERYVERLSEKYDTFGMDREFNSTSRGLITVPQGEGCYGWWLDIDGMTNFIVRQIENCESVTTEPIYYVNPDSQYSYTCNPEWLTKGKDFGDTYFDVDLAAQHLWYYENGELKMESDFVSGYPSASRNTPEGVYKLWYKERNKILRGSSDGRSYASPVDYWNYFSTIGVGFHDASWQNGVFGGTKYQSPEWGSHGCINMPYEKAQYIFDNCDLGTPVFAYW